MVEVCQASGCWIKIDKGNGETIMAKAEEESFFMPKDIVGKDVVISGEAKSKDVSVKQLRHYAIDAGKSKEEIEKITTPQKQIIIMAKGVLVL